MSVKYGAVPPSTCSVNLKRTHQTALFLTESNSCNVATNSWLLTWSISSARCAPFIPLEELEDEDEEKPKSDIFFSIIKRELQIPLTAR